MFSSNNLAHYLNSETYKRPLNLSEELLVCSFNELHAPTISTRKLKLMERGGQFTYTPTSFTFLNLLCGSPKVQTFMISVNLQTYHLLTASPYLFSFQFMSCEHPHQQPRPNLRFWSSCELSKFRDIKLQVNSPGPRWHPYTSLRATGVFYQLESCLCLLILPEVYYLKM